MIALLALALAGDRPVAPDDSACPGRPLVVGVAYVAPCAQVVMSKERAAWLGAMHAWADAEHDRLVLERVTCAADADAAAEREAWWRGQAERPRVEPALLVGLGIVAGAGLTLGAAAGWGAVTGQ